MVRLRPQCDGGSVAGIEPYDGTAGLYHRFQHRGWSGRTKQTSLFTPGMHTTRAAHGLRSGGTVQTDVQALSLDMRVFHARLVDKAGDLDNGDL